MKVVQIIPTLSSGDAIGNETLTIDQILKNDGVETSIYSEYVTPPLKKNMVKDIDRLTELTKEDIAILHLSTSARSNRLFGSLPCKKVVMYHNVTPPEFFRHDNPYLEGLTSQALADVAYLSDKADYCLADSEFNRKDLIEFGYKCPIDVLPILIDFKEYNREPDQKIIDCYKDKTVILFTGRIAPNKKQEDIIRTFYYYKKYYNNEAILILAGKYEEEDVYYRRLRKYIECLQLRDVIFTGHISFEELLAYYKSADAFLCMSEHEGFCVPLLEAMYFNVPVIAYNNTAVPYTMGDAGILINSKNPEEDAGLLNDMMNNKVLRDKILAEQERRLANFDFRKMSSLFENELKIIRHTEGTKQHD